MDFREGFEGRILRSCYQAARGLVKEGGITLPLFSHVAQFRSPLLLRHPVLRVDWPTRVDGLICDCHNLHDRLCFVLLKLVR